MNATMRAVLACEYGGPDVLRTAEVPRPVAGPGEVLLRITAAGTNPVDAECRSGKAAAWFDAGPYVWGWDVSGTVEAAGPGVSGVRPGTPMIGMPRFPSMAAGYAEYVAAPLADLAVLPGGADPVAAAALPLCGLTARQTLARLGLRPGDRLLVNGAAGGVGHLAVQLARRAGVRVVAVGREANHAFLRRMGADEVVDYTRDKVTDVVSGMDGVLDCVGDDDLIVVVRDGGAYARVPDAAGGATELEAVAERRGVRVVRHVVETDGPGVARLAGAYAEGLLQVHVGAVLPLSAAAEAHRRLDAGVSRGKLVLTPEP